MYPAILTFWRRQSFLTEHFQQAFLDDKMDDIQALLKQ